MEYEDLLDAIGKSGCHVMTTNLMDAIGVIEKWYYAQHGGWTDSMGSMLDYKDGYLERCGGQKVGPVEKNA